MQNSLLKSVKEPLPPGEKIGERTDCENEFLSRTEDESDVVGVMEKSPFRKNKNKSTMETTPQGLLL